MDKNALIASAVSGAISALLIGIGVALAGLAVGSGIKTYAIERYVTVEGSAQKEVEADLAVWPIEFKDVHNDLAALRKSLDAKREIIVKFLTDAGFKPNEISHSVAKIITSANKEEKYTAHCVVMLRTANVSAVKKAVEKLGDLMNKGIMLAPESYSGDHIEFRLEGLSKMAPEMVDLATRNARQAADKIARGSGSKVGKIRRATQNEIVVENRDPQSPDRKQIRATASVEFFLR